MRALWHSNAPWAGTGYGQQTALFLPLLRSQGHEIAVSSFYGLNGQQMDWDGFTVYPGGTDTYGNDVLTSHALHWFGGNAAAGAIITLCDVWVLRSPTLKHFTVAAWTPVDHAPCPPAVASFFTKTGAVPIAMSRFGQRQLTLAGLEPLYVPHGVDTKLFHPGVCKRAAAREMLGLPADGFLVGMVAANKGNNPSRKAFPQAFLAFKQLAQEHSDALLYCHCESRGNHMGVNLEEMAEAFGIRDRVRFVDQYALRLGIPQQAMPVVFRAIDVLLNPSMGEGFGIPLIEAQACGTPVIATDCTSMPELVGAGWLVEADLWWDGLQAGFYGYPKPSSILDALREAYKHRRDEKRAVDFAAAYDAELIARDFWKPALEVVEGRLPTSARPIDMSLLQPSAEVPA